MRVEEGCGEDGRVMAAREGLLEQKENVGCQVVPDLEPWREVT